MADSVSFRCNIHVYFFINNKPNFIWDGSLPSYLKKKKKSKHVSQTHFQLGVIAMVLGYAIEVEVCWRFLAHFCFLKCGMPLLPFPFGTQQLRLEVETIGMEDPP